MSRKSIRIFSKPSHLHEDLEKDVNYYLIMLQNREDVEMDFDFDVSQTVVSGVSYTTILIKETTNTITKKDKKEFTVK